MITSSTAGATAGAIMAQTVAESTFQAYWIAAIVVGLGLIALAWAGLGASVVARVISAVVGVIFLGNGAYLFLFADRHTLWELYPFAFILAFLVVGYFFYSRVLERELEQAVRAQLEAERAARAAQRAQLEAERARQEEASSQPDAPAGP
jgi:hypothetical protein